MWSLINECYLILTMKFSGKSTQVPSFILEHEMAKGNPCKIYCTEVWASLVTSRPN